MDKKNLISQSAQSANNLLIQNLPNELVELLDEDLWQVQGGWKYLDNYNVTVRRPLVTPVTPVCDIPPHHPNPEIFTHSHTDHTPFAL